MITADEIRKEIATLNICYANMISSELDLNRYDDNERNEYNPSQRDILYKSLVVNTEIFEQQHKKVDDLLTEYI